MLRRPQQGLVVHASITVRHSLLSWSSRQAGLLVQQPAWLPTVPTTAHSPQPVNHNRHCFSTSPEVGRTSPPISDALPAEVFKSGYSSPLITGCYEAADRKYFGVGMDAGKYIARVHVGKQHVTLARFYTPEQAAQAVDEARIYQGQPPVNFPASKYNVDHVCKPRDFGEFCKEMRADAAQLTKAQKSSIYKGVSAARGKFRAFAWKHMLYCLGRHSTEVEAARAADCGRIYLGQAPTNFPPADYNQKVICSAAPNIDKFRLWMRSELPKVTQPGTPSAITLCTADATSI